MILEQYLIKSRKKENNMEQIITSLLETDAYKLSMGQAIYHQFSDYKTTWTFKCRNKDVKFTEEMVNEIKRQIKESAKLEMAYFDLIKKISKDFKEQNFDEIYKTLKKLRKTEWYKMIDKQYSSDSSTNMNQFYDIDKYKIDEFE